MNERDDRTDEGMRSGEFFRAKEQSGIELSVLKEFLRGCSDSPQRFFHNQLRTRAGSEWFEATTAELAAELDRTGGLLTHKDDREFLRRAKSAGKKKLQVAQQSQSVSTEELAESVALYFGAICLLLAHPETTTLREVSSIGPSSIEETLQVMRETLDSSWQSVIDVAMEHLD